MLGHEGGLVGDELVAEDDAGLGAGRMWGLIPFTAGVALLDSIELR